MRPIRLALVFFLLNVTSIHELPAQQAGWTSWTPAIPNGGVMTFEARASQGWQPSWSTAPCSPTDTVGALLIGKFRCVTATVPQAAQQRGIGYGSIEIDCSIPLDQTGQALPNRFGIRVRHAGGDFPVEWCDIQPRFLSMYYSLDFDPPGAPGNRWGVDGSRTATMSMGASGMTEFYFEEATPRILDGRDFASGSAGNYRLTPHPHGGLDRIGVAADGASRLLLRWRTPSSGSVMVQFEHGAVDPNDGTFGAPNGPSRQIPVTIPTIEELPSEHYAYIEFRAPVDFETTAPSSGLSRVLLSVTFTPAYSTLPTSLWWPHISLHRAPVVLVHGLWGSPAGWDDWLSADLGHFRVLDYSATNGESLSVNAPILSQQVEAFLEDLRSSPGIAVCRVDWVAHSLGGLLARQIYRDGNAMASSRPWRRADNFGMGDIRKIITVTTPHSGSPIANALLAADTSTAVMRQLISLANNVGGAVRDLAVGSAALRSLGQTDIPSHTIVGLGAESLLPNRASPTAFLEAALTTPFLTGDFELAGVFALLGLLSHDPLSVYGGQAHDGIVQAGSQHGGIQMASSTIVYGGNQAITHMTVRDVAEHPHVLDTVLQLLRTPVGSSSFAPLPAPPLVAPPALNRTAIAPEALAILSPVIAPGGCLSVPNGLAGAPITVAAPIGWAPTDVIIATPRMAIPMYRNGVGWSGVLPTGLPLFDLNYFAVVIAFNKVTGMVARSAPLCVSAAPPFAPLAIIAEPSSVTLVQPLQQERICVYADLGFMRVPLRGGFVVQSQDQDIADGMAEGYVRAKGTGSTTLYLHWQGLMASVVATVAFPVEQPYGTGREGSGGITPLANSSSGPPRVGNSAYALQATGTVGGAIGAMFLDIRVDEVALPGLPPLLVGLNPSTVLYFVVAGGMQGLPGVGTVRVGLGVPSDPSLIGSELFSQFMFIDAIAQGGVSSTNGFMFRIEP